MSNFLRNAKPLPLSLKRLKGILLILVVPFLFSTCTGNEKLSVNPQTGLKKSELQVSQGGQKIIDISTTDCHQSGGYVEDNTIILKTADLNTNVQIALYIDYNTLSDLVTNRAIPAEDPFGGTGRKPSFWGTVIKNNGAETYISGATGTLTLTAFDQNTGLASCQFTFTAAKQSGSGQASFSGSFSNIPIFPDSDAFVNCQSSTPSLGNGTSTTPSNPTSTPSNPTNPGVGNTSITFENPAFTPITITLGGATQTIQPSAKVSFQGKAGSQTTFNASTSGRTSTGDIVGLEITWSSSINFPNSGNTNYPLNVSSNIFFLIVKNNSIRKINKVLVNYQLQSGTTENLAIPNDKQSYRLGYYKAFSNSNVRFENTDVNWYWQFNSSDLRLPFTQNQFITLNAN